METNFPLSPELRVNVLRYHPVPPTTCPVEAPLLAPSLSWEKGPIVFPAICSGGPAWPIGRSSMLQSCGRSSTLHFESSKTVCSAPARLSRIKRQSASKSRTRSLNSEACFCSEQPISKQAEARTENN